MWMVSFLMNLNMHFHIDFNFVKGAFKMQWPGQFEAYLKSWLLVDKYTCFKRLVLDIWVMLHHIWRNLRSDCSTRKNLNRSWKNWVTLTCHWRTRRLLAMQCWPQHFYLDDKMLRSEIETPGSLDKLMATKVREIVVAFNIYSIIQYKRL